MSRAYYDASIPTFLSTPARAVFGELCANYGIDPEGPQREAWEFEIDHLRRTLADLHGHVFFEFQIPRVGKRADVVILAHGVVFVLEYKLRATKFDRQSVDQVMDYALDLKNFHAGSHGLTIVPILVATDAVYREQRLLRGDDGICAPLLSNQKHSREVIDYVLGYLPRREIDADAWAAAPYAPTPTIVEAAQVLYANHSVEDISRSDAGATNLTTTASCVATLVDRAERESKKVVCFVTGVPGAGKTLAGLKIATERKRADPSSRAVFLSGNDPLVTVLREALALDRSQQSGQPLSDARRETRAFIQNIRHFRDETRESPLPPAERVVVFDEAQRAWHRKQLASFMKRKRGVSEFPLSEPAFLLSAMDRHQGWCCVVCLVGGGQEINTGEAGIGEWLVAIETHFPTWTVACSRHILESEYDWDGTLAHRLERLGAEMHEPLHLAVALRSFRAESLSAFMTAIVNGDSDRAQELSSQILNYPVVVSRNIYDARHWVRRHARGTERFGLLASSNALRLRPEGVCVKLDIEPDKWFLKGKDDIRSSFYLEDVATEFHVQGLELDWAILCWDANFRRGDGHWLVNNFVGTKWQTVRDSERQRYVKNSYRVLLTRARQGLCLFVPKGDASDPTRDPSVYNKIFEFLLQCGIPEV